MMSFLMSKECSEQGVNFCFCLDNGSSMSHLGIGPNNSEMNSDEENRGKKFN